MEATISLFDSVLNKIEGSSSAEMVGDFFLSPARLLFGRRYTLEDGLVLRTPETFLTLKTLIAKVAVVCLFPISLISALIGATIKVIAFQKNPDLRLKYSLPVLRNAREEQNFLGRLPPNPLTPNCVNSQQKSRWGKLYNVDPIKIPAGTENPIALLKTVFQTAEEPSFHWKNASLVEEEGGYLHYTYTVEIPSGPLKGTYIDDIDVYYDPNQRHFDIRSASRKGFRDALNLDFSLPGANKKRVEAIRTAFSKSAH